MAQRSNNSGIFELINIRWVTLPNNSCSKSRELPEGFDDHVFF